MSETNTATEWIRKWGPSRSGRKDDAFGPWGGGVLPIGVIISLRIGPGQWKDNATIRPFSSPVFLTFDHRFFAALIIAARPAADKTRFLTTLISLPVESPNAFSAARTPFNWCCSLCNCF